MNVFSYVVLFMFGSCVFYICLTYVIVRVYDCCEQLCANKISDEEQLRK